ncbi:MAG: hypothetical protein GC181_08785 [Bacteroidetes bacterium]|nr:hypothetical protein [Bacteroidota bacterium]
MKLFALYWLVFIVFIPGLCFGQVLIHDDFSDGGKSASFWSFRDSIFDFEASSCRSNSFIANDTFSIRSKLSFPRPDSFVLQFDVRLDFETSSANYVDFFWEEGDTGSFIRLGGKDDAISLMYGRPGISISSEIYTFLKGITGHSHLVLWIELIQNKLTLKTADLTADTLYSFPSSEINSSTKKIRPGLCIRQSTTSFFRKHYWNEFSLFTKNTKTEAPALTQTTLRGDSIIDVFFNVDVKLYSINPEIRINGNVVKSCNWVRDDQLTVRPELMLAEEQTIRIRGINSSPYSKELDTTFTLHYKKPYRAAKGEIFITEIMCDPEPVIGLPDVEYIELYNATHEILSVKNFGIADPTRTALFPDSVVPPRSYVVLCDERLTHLWADGIPVIGIKDFPSLNNSGDSILLINSFGDTIDVVCYSSDLWVPAWKGSGGWSLEMIDKDEPCLDANWTCSVSHEGGSPGIVNSVDRRIRDDIPPEVANIFMESPTEIRITFTEKTEENFCTSSVKINQSETGFIRIDKNTISIQLKESLQPEQHYSVEISGFCDCSGNANRDTALQITWPVIVGKEDILITEILFNPNNGVPEFIEIQNRNKNAIDLSSLRVTTINSDGEFETLKPLTSLHKPIFPNDFLCLTVDENAIRKAYPNSEKMHILQVESLPALSNSGGTVVITDISGTLIDSASFNEEMHAHLPETKGVSLERINAELPNQTEFWTSASYTTGYATPGYQNASWQYLALKPESKIHIYPDPFSPNLDGYNDALNIEVTAGNVECLVTISVFTIEGILVSQPVQNAHINGSGLLIWDGSTDDGGVLNEGIYLISVETLIDKSYHRQQFPVTLRWQ